jgi:hypothetical protein
VYAVYCNAYRSGEEEEACLYRLEIKMVKTGFEYGLNGGVVDYNSI